MNTILLSSRQIITNSWIIFSQSGKFIKFSSSVELFQSCWLPWNNFKQFLRDTERASERDKKRRSEKWFSYLFK